eukprot:CAMPEP_0114234564 /NCGR_PEP_ID=MMETSP0058-20121206/5775_1 /TAXON_ID=36894 /ORGANISM="Pyramimonas parkeae, CCMP726" /LENGTH=259 /DNA_ID=CAMNT_0001346249 /DNA_START=29 /DNA_END=808 /DNA_ORIENTATION=-
MRHMASSRIRGRASKAWTSTWRGARMQVTRRAPGQSKRHIVFATTEEGGGDGSIPPSKSGGGGGDGGAGDGDKRGDDGSEAPSGWLGAYLRALDQSPLMVKSLTTAVLNIAGDAISQLGIEKDGYNLKRAFIFFLLGGGLVGPTLHFWYGTLFKLVTLQGTAGTVLRLFLDQALFAPSFVALFFAALFTLEGHPQDVPKKLKQDWWEATQTNWKIWIPFQFINFRFVPPNLQVMGANVIALVWNTYLSWAGHKDMEETK